MFGHDRSLLSSMSAVSASVIPVSVIPVVSVVWCLLSAVCGASGVSCLVSRVESLRESGVARQDSRDSRPGPP